MVGIVVGIVVGFLTDVVADILVSILVGIMAGVQAGILVGLLIGSLAGPFAKPSRYGGGFDGCVRSRGSLSRCRGLCSIGSLGRSNLLWRHCVWRGRLYMECSAICNRGL